MDTRWVVRGGFGLEHLGREPDPVEPIGAHGVALRMSAWSLNYRDLLMARGQYDPRLALPYVPLSDGVGTVEEIGPGVTRVAVGDRVCPTFAVGWVHGDPTEDQVRTARGGRGPGVLALRTVVPEADLVKVPATLSDPEAATLPCAALTAWSALVTHGPIAAGDTVLVIGSGGVSLFALQIARMRGARVVAVTSSEARAERLRALGAEHTVLYSADPDWGRTVRRWSDGGVDRVVEVGGAGTFAQSLDAVRVGGTVSVIGNLAGASTWLSVLPILMRQIRCQGVFVGHRTGFEAMVAAFAAHEVRPVIDRVFPFVEADRAFAHLAAGTHTGKVCVATA